MLLKFINLIWHRKYNKKKLFKKKLQKKNIWTGFINFNLQNNCLEK